MKRIKGEKYMVSVGSKILRCQRCNGRILGREGYLKLVRGWIKGEWERDIIFCNPCCSLICDVFREGYANKEKIYEQRLKQLTLKRLK